jgi:hypothetical protein
LTRIIKKIENVLGDLDYHRCMAQKDLDTKKFDILTRNELQMKIDTYRHSMEVLANEFGLMLNTE